MEQDTNEEIEKLAESYVGVRNTRMQRTREEVEKRVLLVDAMHRHKLDRYEFDGYIVTLETKEKVKVKTREDDEDEEQPEDDQ